MKIDQKRSVVEVGVPYWVLVDAVGLPVAFLLLAIGASLPPLYFFPVIHRDTNFGFRPNFEVRTIWVHPPPRFFFTW